MSDATSAFVRPLLAADAGDVLAAFASAPDMARQGSVATFEDAERYVARLVDPRSAHRPWAVESGERLVGLVCVTVDAANRNGWFWYWMTAEARGRGWMSRAAATVADWALTSGGLERLELGHRVNNPASGAVARAAGFLLEGKERAKFLVDGARVDVSTYGRLQTDPAPRYVPLEMRHEIEAPNPSDPRPPWSAFKDQPVPDDVARLLATVPEWFGQPEANADYIDAARHKETWTVRDAEGVVVGVTLVDRHFPHVAEIHLTVVDRARHGAGIGTAMVAAVEADATQRGVRFLEVKTLGASHPDVGYARTREFYVKQGFLPLEETDLWGEHSPCLIMVKPLTSGRTSKPGERT